MQPDRRAFLQGSLVAAAPLFVPRSAWGANDRPVFGVIGTGSRARWLNSTFQKLGAQCAALADCYEPHLELARQESPAGVKTYENYKDLLAQPGLDFVVIGTPDH
jgi:predicted dehydrogenase